MKKFEKNNKEIALNLLFAPHNKEEIWPAYISKHNHQLKNQVILLMIADDSKGWHYLAVRSLPALLRGVTSNHDENNKRPLPIGKNKKVIRLFKDELAGKIIKKFCALRAKIYAYLMGNDNEVKKAKGTKKCVKKRELIFENYKDCLFNGEAILKSQQRFKSDHH